MTERGKSALAGSGHTQETWSRSTRERHPSTPTLHLRSVLEHVNMLELLLLELVLYLISRMMYLAKLWLQCLLDPLMRYLLLLGELLLLN
jgi:hypothetical protein